MTQERWAEALGCSVENVRGYESGAWMPSDDMAMRMADAAGMPVLAYWHLYNKAQYTGADLPDVDVMSLPQAVLSLISRINEFAQRHRTDNLIDIAADGVIDAGERGTYNEIIEELDAIVQASMALKYAKEVEFDVSK